jgi:LCP family protein required for cell wall assembly
VRTLARAVAGALVVLLVIGIGFVAWMLRPGAEVFRVVRTDTAVEHWSPSKPLWVLLLGDDQRGDTGCGCSDAIHLVGVPAGGGSAVMLNLPRDLRVAIPGKGLRRINEAYARGGAKLAAEVVGQVVGVPISYVIVTTFGGLRSMIDELGGVDVTLAQRIRDKNVGLDSGPGLVHFDGAQALAFARSRKVFADGDIHRTQNQAQLILAVLSGLRSAGMSPADELRYLTTLMRHTRLQGGNATDLYRLGRLALSIDPASVRSVTPAVRGVMVNGAAMLELMPSARSLFGDLADDAILQRS